MKEDKPMVLPDQGDAKSQTLSLGADYSTQYYYNLQSGEIVHSSPVNSWHLAFESLSGGEGVFLNCGANMALVPTSKTNFGDINSTDYVGQQWLQDDPNGLVGESALGEWNKDAASRSKIYIVRLDPNNDILKAVRIKSVTNSGYVFEVQDLQTGIYSSHSLPKDFTRDYTYFDLNTLQPVTTVEPLKESWDILFTRYGFTFYDQNPPLPYVVTGVLSILEPQFIRILLMNFMACHLIFYLIVRCPQIKIL